MILRKGGRLYCKKDLLVSVSSYINNTYSNYDQLYFIMGGHYTIIQYDSNNVVLSSEQGSYPLPIVSLGDYFSTIKEERKLKLQKLSI